LNGTSFYDNILVAIIIHTVLMDMLIQTIIQLI